MKRRSSGREAPHPPEESVLEESSTGKRRESRGLGHREKVIIFIDHGEARGGFRHAPRWAAEDESFAARELSLGGRDHALDQDLTAFDLAPPLRRRRVAVALREICKEGPALGPPAQPFAIVEAEVQHGFSGL